MYHSIHKMYNAWPNDTRIFVGHDYPPANGNRSVSMKSQKSGMIVLLMTKQVRGDDYIRSSQAIQCDGQ